MRPANGGGIGQSADGCAPLGARSSDTPRPTPSRRRDTALLPSHRPRDMLRSCPAARASNARAHAGRVPKACARPSLLPQQTTRGRMFAWHGVPGGRAPVGQYQVGSANHYSALPEMRPVTGRSTAAARHWAFLGILLLRSACVRRVALSMSMRFSCTVPSSRSGSSSSFLPCSAPTQQSGADEAVLHDVATGQTSV